MSISVSPYKELSDFEWLHEKYKVEKLSIYDIAEQIGCSVTAVCRAMGRFNIEARSPMDSRASRKFPELYDEAWLRQKYENEKLSYREVAAIIGCTIPAVISALKRCSIATREQLDSRITREAKRLLDPVKDFDYIKRLYTVEHKSVSEIASISGISMSSVFRILKKIGVELRQPPGTGTRAKRSESLGDRDWLENEYLKLNKTVKQIAEEQECTPAAVTKALWRRGILKRKPLPWDKPSETRENRRYLKERKKDYAIIWKPEHPAAGVRGYVYEHRLVAEKELGRYLTPEEVVHHLNSKKNDNRPENLMIFPSNAEHLLFEANPPAWVPRCPDCGSLAPELLEKRPDDVPMYWKGW